MMKKKILVTTFSEEVLDIHGNANKQRDRLRKLSEIYSKVFSIETVSNCFWYEHPIKIKSKRLDIEGQMFFPKTLSDFISICSSLSIPLYWDEEVFTTNIHHHFRYKNVID